MVRVPVHREVVLPRTGCWHTLNRLDAARDVWTDVEPLGTAGVPNAFEPYAAPLAIVIVCHCFTADMIREEAQWVIASMRHVETRLNLCFSCLPTCDYVRQLRVRPVHQIQEPLQRNDLVRATLGQLNVAIRL